MKYSFRNDYGDVGHPEVLKSLLSIVGQQYVGYGFDEITKRLENMMRELTGANVEIFINSGGTQTNLVLISKALKSYEAVISVKSGHINVHETGAVEGTGHKIITVEGSEGKLQPKDIEEVVKNCTDCHVVKPHLVYISNSTEIGTVYTKEELCKLYETCQKQQLLLYVDGARLAVAMDSTGLTWQELAKYSDAFYIGGTKNGLPYGELLVIKNKQLKEDFAYHLKNRGAMLAKTFVVSQMFLTILTTGLYLQNGKHANDMAKILAVGLDKLGAKHKYLPVTNQIFIEVTNDELKALHELYDFEIWETGEKVTVIRLVTSWLTDEAKCDEFLADFAKIKELV